MSFLKSSTVMSAIVVCAMFLSLRFSIFISRVLVSMAAAEQLALQPHRASGASGAGRLDACVRQPVRGRINLPCLNRLTWWLKTGNFLPFQFLPDLGKASDGLHRIQAFASKTTLHTFVRFYHGYPVLAHTMRFRTAAQRLEHQPHAKRSRAERVGLMRMSGAIAISILPGKLVKPCGK
jgi:hypothetical protein